MVHDLDADHRVGGRQHVVDDLLRAVDVAINLYAYGNVPERVVGAGLACGCHDLLSTHLWHVMPSARNVRIPNTQDERRNRKAL